MLTVLFNHVYNIAFFQRQTIEMGNAPRFLWAPLRVLTFGHYAVDVFIVLSGFCLALPVVLKGGVLRQGTIGFYLSRARRILPPYYAALFIALIARWLFMSMGGHKIASSTLTTWGVISHLLLIHDLFPSTIGQLDGPLLSVGVEWRIYFLFPLLVLLWRRTGVIVATVAFFVFAKLLYSWMLNHGFTPMGPTGGGPCPHYILLFAMGAFGTWIAFDASKLARTIRERVAHRIVVCVLFALVIITSSSRYLAFAVLTPLHCESFSA